MANPISRTITATGTYVFGLDYFINPFNVGWDVHIDSGTATFAVNATMDSINPTIGTGYGIVISPNPTWDIAVQASGSASVSGNWTTPVQAIQVDVTAISGQLTVKIVQPFSIN